MDFALLKQNLIHVQLHCAAFLQKHVYRCNRKVFEEWMALLQVLSVEALGCQLLVHKLAEGLVLRDVALGQPLIHEVAFFVVGQLQFLDVLFAMRSSLRGRA